MQSPPSHAQQYHSQLAHSQLAHSQLAGVIYMLLAAVTFTGLGVTIRMLSPRIGGVESFFFRSFTNSLIFIAYALWQRIPIIGKHRRDLAVRGISGTIAGLCYFWALTFIPISEASALFRTSALFMPFLAYFLLRERLSLGRTLCAVIGFAGACFILKPGFGLVGYGPWILLGGAFFNALAMVTLRSLTKREHELTILLAFSLWAALISFVLGYRSFVMPLAHEWWLLIAMSTFGILGQIFQVFAYKYAEATLVTPINYSEILFMGIFGWAFLDQLPDALSIFGMTLIAISGVIIVRLTRKKIAKTAFATPE